jgi:phosphoglycolate phosphatase
MTYKAIIFDLDGTLLNTLDDLGNAFNRVLERNDLPTHAIDKYRYFIGEGAAVLTERALPEELRNESLIKKYLNEFLADYSDNYFIDTKPYDGIHDLLETLDKREIKTAVFSNKPQDATDRCIEKFFHAHKFQAVLGMNNTIPRKPNTAGALKISELFRIHPSEFIFLGDTAIDMTTALNAGMMPVGAAWGFRSERELIDSGAQKVIKRPSELLEFL